MINLLGGRFCPEYMAKPGGIVEKIDKKKTGQYSDLAILILSKQQQMVNVERRDQERLEKSRSQALYTQFNTIKTNNE